MTDQFNFAFVFDTDDAQRDSLALEQKFKSLEKQIKAVSDINGRLAKTNDGLRSTNQALANSVDDLRRKSDEAAKKANALGTVFKNSFTELNSQIALGRMAFQAFDRTIGASIRKAADFEKKIAQISTIFKGGSGGLQELSQQALSTGSRSGFDPTAQAGAIYEAIGAGAETAADATDLLTAANKLAVGGITDTQTSMDGLTSALNAYGRTSKDAEHFADVMFATMDKGKVLIPELSSQMGFLVSTSAAAGVSFEQAMAAIAAATAGGVRPETAFTGLNQAISSIIAPSDQAKGLAKELGIQFDETALRSKGLAQFLLETREATKGSSEAMQTLFGDVRGMRVVLALTNNNAQIFNKSLDAIADSAGRADKAVAIMGDTASKQFDRLGASWSRLTIAVTDTDAPKAMVQSWADGLEDLALLFEQGTSIDRVKTAIRNLSLGDIAASYYLPSALMVGASRLGRANDVQIDSVASIAEQDAAEQARIDQMVASASGSMTPAGSDLGRMGPGVGAKMATRNADARRKRAEKEAKEAKRRADEIREAQMRASGLDPTDVATGKFFGPSEDDFIMAQREAEQQAIKSAGMDGTRAGDFGGSFFEGFAGMQRVNANLKQIVEDEDFKKIETEAKASAKKTEDAWFGVSQTIAGAFSSGILAAHSFGDAVKNILSNISNQAISMTTSGIFSGLFSIATGGAGGFLGGFKRALGFSHGGLVGSGGRPLLPSFAGGGLVGGSFSSTPAGGQDDRIIGAKTGELILPTNLTAALAGLMRTPTPAASFASGGMVGPGGMMGGPTIVNIQSMGEVTRQDADRIANRRLQPAFERNQRNRVRTTVFNRTPNRR